MRYLRLILQFLKASIQQEMAYSFNFFIQLVYSLLNLGVGLAGLGILYNQIETIQGWDYASTLALLGIYLFVSAIRGLFIGPSLEALAGMEGEIMAGKFDFTLLRPINLQFLASFRYWQPFALLDLFLGIGVIIRAVTLPGSSVTIPNVLTFGLTLTTGLIVLYASCWPSHPLYSGARVSCSRGCLMVSSNWPGIRWPVSWLVQVRAHLDHTGRGDHHYSRQSTHRDCDERGYIRGAGFGWSALCGSVFVVQIQREAYMQAQKQLNHK